MVDGETRNSSPGNNSSDTSLTDEEQLCKQAEFQHRLAELNDQLLQKETVVKQMLQNDEAIAEMKSKYEVCCEVCAAYRSTDNVQLS